MNFGLSQRIVNNKNFEGILVDGIMRIFIFWDLRTWWMFGKNWQFKWHLSIENSGVWLLQKQFWSIF